MPRYFFNLYDDLDISDEEGIELPDLAAALSMAIRYAGSTLREAGDRLSFGDTWSLEVSDITKRPLFHIDLQIRPAPEAVLRPVRGVLPADV